jgi:hypothetical protein
MKSGCSDPAYTLRAGAAESSPLYGAGDRKTRGISGYYRL